MSTSVCAVTNSSTEIERALASQEVAPEATVRYGGMLGDGLRSGLETGADWLWLLEGFSAPRPHALSCMLEALDRVEGLPAPAVLAGVVLGHDGRVDPRRAAWFRRAPTEPVMVAVERRLLPIRAASGALLVHRSVIRTGPGPRRALRAPGAVLEWTARVLRDEAGYLVADSEYDLVARRSQSVADARTAATLVLGGAFSGVARPKLVRDLLELASTPSRKRTAQPVA